MAQGIQLAGGFGAGGVRDALVDLIAQRMAQQQFDEMKAQRAQQAERQAMLDARALDETTYRRGRDTIEDQTRARERAEDQAESTRRFGIVRSEEDAAAQERQFEREMGVKSKGEEREMRAKEREEDRRFQSSERAKDRAASAARAGGNDRLVQIAGPNGTAVWVRESEAVGKPAAQAARSVTGTERSALAFYNRGKEASDTMAAKDASGKSLEERIAGQSTAGQLWGSLMPNMVQSEDQQLYRQAQRAFTEARLRKESGAAIPQGEYDTDARTYFAQPGDSPKLIEQKRLARQNVLEGIKFASGKAFDEFYGESATPPTGPAAAPAANGVGAPAKQRLKFDPATGGFVTGTP